MKDNFVRLILKSLNKILSKITISPVDEQLYIWYYKFIFRCLENDFQKSNDKYLKSIQKWIIQKKKFHLYFG